ncbi:methylcrotonoyl-CoA carboxylase, partial [Sphingomonas sp. HMWF008]
GYLGADQSPERLAAEAAAVGYPVLIKAVAGGGGKGMRRVDDPAEFADALVSCQREAASSFGNTDVLIEKYILSPRHIEVQVFGDTHGNVVHLFERDCSLQRRHQKVIEEAPAPGMDVATREAICAAAVKAARAVDYVGAGTIEFIADASEGLRADRIWFMEMNTRLQVEHPVTEEITGVDLVEWQLRVAGGEVLPKRQEELSINGWAIEARLYAEDPATGFLPSPGLVDRLLFHWQARLESAVEEGDRVSTFYDPMIAKVIATGQCRDEARTNLMTYLNESFVGPLRTNKAFLYECLALPAFVDGLMDTGLIARSGDALTERRPPSDLVLKTAGHRFRRDWTDDIDWDQRKLAEGLFGFRLNSAPRTSVMIFEGGGAYSVSAESRDTSTGLSSDREKDGTLIVTERGETYFFTSRPDAGTAAGAAADGAILSPMPGRIIAVAVAAGDSVAKGQKLVTLEAMKMEHSLTAPFDGTVAELSAVEGAQVSEGAVLVRLTAADAA